MESQAFILMCVSACVDVGSRVCPCVCACVRVFVWVSACRLFWVGCIYGRKDDAARFGTFCHAALEFLLQTGRRPVSSPCMLHATANPKALKPLQSMLHAPCS